jgi:hypothetical protein
MRGQNNTLVINLNQPEANNSSNLIAQGYTQFFFTGSPFPEVRNHPEMFKLPTEIPQF